MLGIILYKRVTNLLEFSYPFCDSVKIVSERALPVTSLDNYKFLGNSALASFDIAQ